MTMNGGRGMPNDMTFDDQGGREFQSTHKIDEIISEQPLKKRTKSILEPLDYLRKYWGFAHAIFCFYCFNSELPISQ